MNKLTIFNFLKGMTQTKEEYDFSLPEVNTAYNQYMLNRYISMVEMFIPLVNQMNRMQNVPNDIHYEFYKSILPKRNIYFKYISKVKNVNQQDIDYIAEYYEISTREARMYADILDEKDIKKITKKFDYGRKR